MADVKIDLLTKNELFLHDSNIVLYLLNTYRIQGITDKKLYVSPKPSYLNQNQH